MDETPRPDMLAAARCVRSGRLTEATALLQRLLRGERQPRTTAGSTAAAPAAGTIDLMAEAVEVPDPARAAGAAGWPAGGAARTNQPRLPEVLSGCLERLAGGLSTALDGLAAPFQPRPPDRSMPDGTRFLAGTYADEAGSRDYRLYVPSGYHGEPVPLVVMLHGCTQSVEDFAAGTGMNALAEERGCLVLYPAQARAANANLCWNWFNPGDQRRDRGEPALIAGLTRRVAREHAVDPQRIYVAGLSAGGAAAAILAATYPDLYAAVGVHSGLAPGAASDLPSAFAAMRQGGGVATDPRVGGVPGTDQRRTVPTIVFHGDRDTVVNPCNGDQIIAQARGTATGLQPTATVQRGQVPGGRAYRRTLHADAGGRAILEHWLVHGAGHAWSGGSPAGSCTDPQGPDAGREMLRFFLEHPQPAAGRTRWSCR